MVSNTTIELINYSKDLDIEYNTKLIVLFTLLIYCLVMFWFSFRMKDDHIWQVLVKQILFRWATLPYIILFFIPLMMVYRGVPLEAIFELILQAYIILFVVFTLLFLVFGFEWVASFLGIKNMGQYLKNGLARRWK